MFGANDGLVSNLALVLGISASGVSNHTVLVTGAAGVLAGALSMGAGEYVSVRSQQELLQASTPDPHAGAAVPALDVDVNELALVYRARGMSETKPQSMPTKFSVNIRGRYRAIRLRCNRFRRARGDRHWLARRCFELLLLRSGALIPVFPYLFGLQGVAALVVATVLVGIALIGTGVIVGLLSGGPPRGARCANCSSDTAPPQSHICWVYCWAWELVSRIPPCSQPRLW